MVHVTVRTLKIPVWSSPHLQPQSQLRHVLPSVLQALQELPTSALSHLLFP